MKRLLKVQQNLKAPKNQRNNFGKYNYRSAEDIIEAVKPLLHSEGLLLTISDDIKQIGDRIYIEASVMVIDAETGKSLEETRAYAREADKRPGMDASQITGSASSYARKYALNGMFAIDDTKDADTDEQHKQCAAKETAPEILDEWRDTINGCTNTQELTKVWKNMSAEMQVKLKEEVAVKGKELQHG